MSSRAYSLLALGDSYTIGEGVSAAERFPCQTIQLLRAAGIPFSDPVIVAKTGWTTDELMQGIAATPAFGATPPSHDFVTLLIGVNNEYRGRSITEYAEQFGELLEQAIRFAGGRSAHTFVLSIPDWGITPFAEAHLPDKLGRDRAMVAAEIDAFNTTAREIAHRYRTGFIDITEHTRAVGLPALKAEESSPISPVRPKEEGSWLAADGLHPSGREYRRWAGLLAERIRERIMA